MIQLFRTLLVCLFFFSLTSCSDKKGNVSHPKSEFVSLTAEESGFDFTNFLNEDELKSPFNYINAYTGGGVAIGDINNDGFQDIFIAGNMTSSKLFLNQGGMKFKDITSEAGVTTSGWTSAVTMADINNDGWLDIYVCRSYHDTPEERANLCFMNNGDGTFTEIASLIGIDDTNYSIAASFFDYDRDGDLDLVVGNHPRYRLVPLSVHYGFWRNPVLHFSNRLFRNDGSKFTEVTESAGLLTYGFTLGLTTSDFNMDGWPDIIITVDHDEPDYFLLNNRNGTFSNVIDAFTNQTSLSSMGIDAGDVNHDEYPDIIVAEMLSEDHYREKVSMGMQSVKRFHYMTDTLRYKYYQMHNFMYLNNGNGNFSDISQMAGVSKSDWSWATLFLDYDNDGWQDLYVTNGWYKDIYHKDRQLELDETMKALGDDMRTKNEMASEYAKKAPIVRIANYLFKNNGNLTFKKVGNEVGLDQKTISTGAAYGDLDNDGDLDLVVNNIGDPSLLYENKSRSNNKYLRIEFDSKPIAYEGSKVFLYVDGDVQLREMLTTRGFLSSCEHVVHFGVGEVTEIDSLKVVWPNGRMQILEGVRPNQTISVKYEDAKSTWKNSKDQITIASNVTSSSSGLDFKHIENEFNDYDIQVLLPHKISEQGPAIAKGDVNNDGLEDLFFGNAHNSPGALFIQSQDGTFSKKRNQIFENDKVFEDGASAFFDADGDQDLDLIITGSGYHFDERDRRYQPRLYLNDGNGQFVKANNALPTHPYPSISIAIDDFDDDGDEDIFLGGHVKPKAYPLSSLSALFINDGEGNFSNQINEISPDLENFGIVNEAIWIDLNSDNKEDLITVGEWMPITFWIQREGKLVNQTDEYLSKELKGWWNSIDATDIDGDGLVDLIVGNLGLNYKYHASEEKPFLVYSSDIDSNDTYDIVLGTYYGDVMYPVRGRSCSTEQIPDVGQEFPTFEAFANADINMVYGDNLESAQKHEVNEFSSIILYQEKDGSFSPVQLPMETQVSPINDALILDINGDNLDDMILGGNLYQSEIETGRADSGRGNILLNLGDRKFRSLPVYESGLFLNSDVKSLSLINIGSDGIPHVVVGNNNAECELIRLNLE